MTARCAGGRGAPEPEGGEAECEWAGRGGHSEIQAHAARPEAPRGAGYTGAWPKTFRHDIDEPMTTETRIPENPFTEDADRADSSSSLSKAIQEHLDLKQRNAGLDSTMPLDRYSIEDPFENHPLFKSEEQARLEETLDGAPTTESQPAAQWPGEERRAGGAGARRGPLGSLARLRLGRVTRRRRASRR